jgi:hypothetical protein
MTGKTTVTITAVDAVSVKSTSDIASLTGGTGVTVNAIVGPAIVTGATTTDVTGTKQDLIDVNMGHWPKSMDNEVFRYIVDNWSCKLNKWHNCYHDG